MQMPFNHPAMLPSQEFSATHSSPPCLETGNEDNMDVMTKMIISMIHALDKSDLDRILGSEESTSQSF